MEPLVGIIVPVFNTENYLKECLDSIKKQTYQNFVCVIVDDGSIDNSFQLAKEYENVDNGNNKKFLIYSKTNGGVSSARNYALKVLESLKQQPEYICFIDSDDIVKSQFLEDFISNLKQTCADYAVCGYDVFDKSGVVNRKTRKIIGQELDNQEILEHFFATKRFAYGRGTKNRYYDSTYTWALFNKCFKFEVVKNERFDETLKNCEDMKFFLNIYSKLKKGVILDKNLYLYRLRRGSLVHNKERDFEMQLTNYNVLNSALQQKKYSGDVTSILALTMCRVCFDCFYKSVEYSNFIYAKKFFDEIKKYIKLIEKKEIQGELKRKVLRAKFGFKINLLYAKFKYRKKKNKESEKERLLYS